METIFIDSNNCCHRKNDGTMASIDTAFFYGKCDAFVEGYKCEVSGDYAMFYPWKNYEELDAAQREYERELAQAARILLGEVSV